MSARRFARSARAPVWFRVGAALLALAGAACIPLTLKPRAVPGPVCDYSRRSGFPGPADPMRGRARADFFVDGATDAPT